MLSRQIAFLVAIGLLLFHFVAPVSASEITLDAYRTLLESVQNQLAAGESLVSVTAQLEGVTAVELPSGERVAVDTSFLVLELREVSLDCRDCVRRVERLIKAHVATLPDSSIVVTVDGTSADLTSADPQTELNTILARGEFDYEPEPLSLRERIWRQIQDWFYQLLLGAGGNVSGWVLAAGLALGLVALLYYWSRRLSAEFAPESELAFADIDNPDLTGDDALLMANKLSQRGDYRSAVRYLYLSLLLLLDERGLLRYDRSKTNREYLRNVRGSAELSTILTDVVDVFDRTWYGFQPLSSAEYNHYAAQVEQLSRKR